MKFTKKLSAVSKIQFGKENSFNLIWPWNQDFEQKDLSSNESRDQYLEDGNLVFRSCFSALTTKINLLRIPKKCYFPAKFVVSLIIVFKGCRFQSKVNLRSLGNNVAYLILPNGIINFVDAHLIQILMFTLWRTVWQAKWDAFTGGGKMARGEKNGKLERITLWN